MAKSILIFLISYSSVVAYGQKTGVYLTQNGRVHFCSDAPLELIEAQTDMLQGVIDPAENTFALQLEIKSFEGFNSPLQQVHFNENYMESRRYSRATFSGKIIEKVDLEKEGTYQVRTKGKLTIHDVARERIIKSTVKVEGGKLLVKAQFTILLDEHDIDIPKVVSQKIAAEVKVEVEAVFNKN